MAIWLIVTALFTWTLLGIVFMDQWFPAWLSRLTGILLGVGFLAFVFRRRFQRIALVGLAVVSLAVLCFYQTRRPSHDRNWSIGQQLLPTARIRESIVEIENLRSFRYKGDKIDQRYVSRRLDLDLIESAWFGVDRFAKMEALAHTFVSFGFRKDESPDAKIDYVAFSIETRREIDEHTFSPLRGMFRNYEIIYVIADEQDVLSIRTDVRNHPVQLYPVKARKSQLQQMFLDMVRRANGIAKQPEFYDTLSSNCTNNLVYHINRVTTWPISSFEREIIFPGYSDWLAFRHDLIDTELSLEEARKYFRVDDRAKQFDGSLDFSTFIRQRPGADLP